MNETATPPTDPHEPEPHIVTLSGGPVAITDEGDGPVLVFVHAGMWSSIWRQVVRRLRDEFRCITVDFPGFGLAPDGDSAPPTLAALADTLAELVGAFDLRRYTLIAHDLGGPVGLAAAAAHPDRLEGIVLANTFAWRPQRRALRMMLRVMGSGALRRLDGATGVIPALTATRFGVGRHLDASERASFRAPFADRRRIERFHDLMRSALDSAPLFATVESAIAGPHASQPVLTIFGERNDPFGFQQRIADRFADHEGHIVPGGHHFPMCDDPELFASLVRVWHRTRVLGAAATSGTGASPPKAAPVEPRWRARGRRSRSRRRQ